MSYHPTCKLSSGREGRVTPFLPKAHAVLSRAPQPNINFWLCGTSLSSGCFPSAFHCAQCCLFFESNVFLSVQPLLPLVSFLSSQENVCIHCLYSSCQLIANWFSTPRPPQSPSDFFVAESKSCSPIPFSLSSRQHLPSVLVLGLLFRHCFLWLLHPQPSRGRERAVRTPCSPHFSPSSLLLFLFPL